MTSIFLRDGAGVQTDDITSSAFPDYPHDLIWVGGARGWLHKVTGAFVGTPAEVRTGGLPVQLNPVNPTSLSSPVFDSVSGNVFVGDYGGFFYRVSPTAAVTKSSQIDFGAVWLRVPSSTRPPGMFMFFSPAMAARPAPDLSLVPPFTSSQPISGPDQWYGSKGRK